MTSGDHPRLRGDHVKRADVYVGEIGSPPLTRGPHGDLATAGPVVRITPAYAGTTVRLIAFF